MHKIIITCKHVPLILFLNHPEFFLFKTQKTKQNKNVGFVFLSSRIAYPGSEERESD